MSWKNCFTFRPMKNDFVFYSLLHLSDVLVTISAVIIILKANHVLGRRWVTLQILTRGIWNMI